MVVWEWWFVHISMNYICSICKKSKPETEFYARKGSKGIWCRCKSCEKVRRTKYRGNYYYYHKVKGQWLPYLKTKYGNPPKCQCCGKKLSWTTKVRILMVHLDHQNGGEELIKRTPMSWVGKNRFCEKNTKIFELCDFGVLCHSCNKSLPTKNRAMWLKSVTDYIYRHERSKISHTLV
jgi:hypothetical protein